MRYIINYLTSGQKDQMALDAANAAEAVSMAERSANPRTSGARRFELISVFLDRQPEPRLTGQNYGGMFDEVAAPAAH